MFSVFRPLEELSCFLWPQWLGVKAFHGHPCYGYLLVMLEFVSPTLLLPDSPSPLRRGPKEHQELGQIGKPDIESQHLLKKLEGAEGASLCSHKKNMALQKLKKDPLDSLQCGTCYVSEACHLPPHPRPAGELYPGLLLLPPLPLGPPD